MGSGSRIYTGETLVRLIDVLPSLAHCYLVNSGDGDIVALRQDVEREFAWPIVLAYCSNYLSRDLREVMIFPFHLPAPFNHVTRVVSICAGQQVIRITTWRVIALMSHYYVGRQWPVGQLIGNATRVLAASIKADLPVTSPALGKASDPQPAGLTIFLNQRPKVSRRLNVFHIASVRAKLGGFSVSFKIAWLNSEWLFAKFAGAWLARYSLLTHDLNLRNRLGFWSGSSDCFRSPVSRSHFSMEVAPCRA